MTQFALWLSANGYSRYSFMVKHGLPEKSVNWLAEPGCYAKPMRAIPFETLAAVSAITGIPAGELVEDVIEAEPRDVVTNRVLE